MPGETSEGLARRNAELSARVVELTQALARSQAFAKLHASVVHDLRNAFHVTRLAAETITQTTENAEDRDLAETILTASEHGGALARDLLALVRNEDVETSNVSGAEVVARLERLTQRFSAQGIQCVFEPAPDVWSVRVERPQLEAALLNFCVNARDAMPRGGTLRVTARNLADVAPRSMLPRDDYVEFAVADTGSGMSRDVLERATEAFFTTKQQSGGTGLGLAMANTFASRSGGALIIESATGRGTTVRLVLPRAPSLGETIDVDPEAREKLDEIAHSIRTQDLRQALKDWRALCPTNGFPRLVAAERQLVAQSEHTLLVAVDPDAAPPLLRLVRLGGALERALGRTKLDDFTLEGSLAVGTLAAAYRRTYRSRFPSYEYASYAFEEKSPEVFERLILPVAADGRHVSHLLGVIRLSKTMNLKGGGHVKAE